MPLDPATSAASASDLLDTEAWGARGGSTVNKVLGSGEPLRNSMRMPGDAGKAARGGFRPSDTPLGFSAWAW
jgi:hypothetical protein